MKIGRWSLSRREEGGFSLCEEIPVPSDVAERAVETVERGRFDLRVFWLALALVGKAVWLVRDLIRWLIGRKNCRKTLR